jgi:hypothetical protein
MQGLCTQSTRKGPRTNYFHELQTQQTKYLHLNNNHEELAPSDKEHINLKI